MGAVPMQGLRIVKGQELLTQYRFNTHTAEHYFCSRCGIYTHHRRRSRPVPHAAAPASIRVTPKAHSRFNKQRGGSMRTS